MDRVVLDEKARLIAENDAIATVDQMPALEFLQDELIDEWRGWVARLLGWDFTWERLKRALNRMLSRQRRGAAGRGRIPR